MKEVENVARIGYTVCEPIICDVAEMRGLVNTEMIGPMNVTDMVFPNEVLR